MRITHTSPEVITKIHNSGLFDDCLFFSSDEYAMGKVAAVYELEIDEDEIISASELYDEDLISHIASVLEISEEDAERVLDDRDSVFDHGKDGEDSWWIQAKQGECAKKMGFKACQSEDEQGTVYIVPMMGREADLIRVR